MTQYQRSQRDQLKIKPTRRHDLIAIEKTFDTDSHAGLWLDKYMRSTLKDADRTKEVKEKTALVRELADEKNLEPEGYETFFDIWCKTLQQLGAQETQARTPDTSRLAVGLGIDGVLETNIALHRTWGIPYIPGSAIKGLVASYAHKYLQGEWCRDKALHKEFFGDTTQRGAMTFYDALPKPNTSYLLEDVMTPHHSDYYGGKTNNQNDSIFPPADWDKPVPISFLSAQGEFVIYLNALMITTLNAKPEELEQAKIQATQKIQITQTILIAALEKEGIGAKTSSGYGRLISLQQEAPKNNSGESERIQIKSDKPSIDAEQQARALLERENKKAQAILEELDNEQKIRMFRQQPSNLIGRINDLQCEKQLKLETARKAISLVSEEELKKSGIRDGQEKSWYTKFLELLEGTT